MKWTCKSVTATTGMSSDSDPAIRFGGKRRKCSSSFSVSFWNVCVIILILWSFCGLTAGDISSVLSHRHRLHHGASHARPRARRDGNTPSPYAMQSDAYTRGTDYKTISDSTGHQNLHKPDFFDCANYRPETPEGQPEGTPVIQVEARDDDPIESGGTVTYSIVSDDDSQDAFAVDPHSGWLTTKKSFDRDEPRREKEVYVTLRAMDNGWPQLDAVCTLKVKITDINDNSPMFDKYVYDEKVPQDHNVGQTVMRISATDIDEGNNGTVVYSLQPDRSSPRDIDYFEVVPLNGEVKLKKQITDFRVFRLRAVAHDKGTPEPRNSSTALNIEVIEPHKKPPRFIPNFDTVRYLKEGFSRSGNRSAAIFEIEASANAEEDGVLFFSLYKGQTEATNKDNTFTLEPDPVNKNRALIKLDKDLDYETVNEYILTVRASNKYNLAAETQIIVKVEDENDNKPNFQEGLVGTVLENEPIGTSVMRVRAYDLDGTSPNNKVTLSLSEDDSRNFHIDPETGEITTRKMFDRESQDVYQLTVIARDGAPSAISHNGLPNERPTVLKIEIADRNDNEPVFAKERYEAEINEDADLNSKVIEVKALDKDTASVLTYSITEGNIGDAFAIGYPNSGIIVIKNNLDYEQIQRYVLKIRASDSLHDTFTEVVVNVININDNPPVFEPMETNITIQEETVPRDCIFRVRAYDPDIGDRNEPQNIAFFIESGKDHFSVDKYDGCVKVIKPLDRDPPNGYPWHAVRVGAKDEGGSQPTSLAHYQDLSVTLTDINDNAPFLNSSNPVKWEENVPAGRIVELTAQDYDSDENGPPFSFAIASNAEPEIKTWFQIQGSTLNAVKANFDREQRKEYAIPIVIVDTGSPRQTGTSTLTVIIGDQNDNDMEDGESKIFVYKYQQNETYPIGRVYVKDPDDWDLPDKVFSWENGVSPSQFTVDFDSGQISMKPSTSEGEYTLRFRVQDNKWNSQVRAIVNVTVKQIPEEAVIQSGSIRFMGITKEQFIKPDANGKSKQDRLRTEIAKLFGLPEKNVDVFTVINSPHVHDLSIIDVRYSAHGSPYYKQERLDGIVGERRALLERALELNIMMIRVDECISEKKHCESSCRNQLLTSSIPYNIWTNTSSFSGVNAYVHPVCSCDLPSESESVCNPNPCLNNGICLTTLGVKRFECECKDGFEGPRCEKTSVGFQGNGYAWYRPLAVCNESSLEIEITVHESSKNSLILYNGPVYQSAMNITDFISIELKDGKPLLLVDYGTGVSRIYLNQSPFLADGKLHKISVRWNSNRISMQVGDCLQKRETCFNTTSPRGMNSYLNVNGPLQLGGLSVNPKEFRSSMNWDFIPSDRRLAGCISNLTFNGDYYDLGDPSYFIGNVSMGCEGPITLGYASLGVGIPFIIILLICILILLILVIAIVFYRRRRSYEEVKGDPHDDVRENIINYSDEGGGEGDQTGYDLSVLMKPTMNGSYMGEKIPMNDFPLQGQMPGSDNPDIQSFLQGNKHKVDNDPDGLPYDDVRNYAYEGDGNSMGSLSSLASGTDDGDLNFDYLPTFGPRFKKLADMYGGQSSDDESYTAAPPEAWC